MFKFITNLFKKEEVIPVGELHGKLLFVKSGNSKEFYSRLGNHYSKKQLDEIHSAYFSKYPSGKHSDLIWMVYNQLTLDYARINDWWNLSQVYFSMAQFLTNEDKDPFKFQQMGNKFIIMNAMAIRDIEVKAKISTGGCCSICKESDGKLFTLEEAYKTLPIPHKNCTHKVGSYYLCNCSWDIVTEENY